MKDYERNERNERDEMYRIEGKPERKAHKGIRFREESIMTNQLNKQGMNKRRGKKGGIEWKEREER